MSIRIVNYAARGAKGAADQEELLFQIATDRARSDVINRGNLMSDREHAEKLTFQVSVSLGAATRARA
jgi:hypothetical protein